MDIATTVYGGVTDGLEVGLDVGNDVGLAVVGLLVGDSLGAALGLNESGLVTTIAFDVSTVAPTSPFACTFCNNAATLVGFVAGAAIAACMAATADATTAVLSASLSRSACAAMTDALGTATSNAISTASAPSSARLRLRLRLHEPSQMLVTVTCSASTPGIVPATSSSNSRFACGSSSASALTPSRCRLDAKVIMTSFVGAAVGDGDGLSVGDGVGFDEGLTDGDGVPLVSVSTHRWRTLSGTASTKASIESGHRCSTHAPPAPAHACAQLWLA